jgi:hypothetical protein
MRHLQATSQTFTVPWGISASLSPIQAHPGDTIVFFSTQDIPHGIVKLPVGSGDADK